MLRFKKLSLTLASYLLVSSITTAAFSLGGSSWQSSRIQEVQVTESLDLPRLLRMSTGAFLASIIMTTSAVYADEIGRETEAPTYTTGEEVEICVKRGPLGACLRTERRTKDNDNDKADKYFKEPTALVKRKDDEARMAESSEGNALILRLKQQTEDNREKNELLVQQRTFLNDVPANFGPFNGQVVILNVDGKGFTLLQNPQAMRLKKAGFIKDKKFVTQPTQQQIDDALEADSDGFFGGLFGGGKE